MSEFSTIITALSVAGGMALGVERVIEFLKHVMEVDTRGQQERDKEELLAHTRKLLAEAQKNLSEVADLSDEKIAERVSGSEVLSSRKCELKSIDDFFTAPAKPGSAVQQFTDSEGEERFTAPHIPVHAYNPYSPFEAGRFLFFHFAAAGLGIILASVFDLHLMKHFLGDGLGLTSIVKYPLLDILLTGVVIGSGSQPIHLLIRFLTERKVAVEASAKQSNAKVPENLASQRLLRQLVPEEVGEPLWKDIDYKGGVNPEGMKGKHVRTGNPNLIVYHHTAMSSSSSFQDVVDEFLVTKKWLTGYHCVIMPDGAIKPFCPWSHYGNHAKGHNMKSLGIAFHGNFETRPNDRYSNADGRYGNQAPTEAQLNSAARVVALWVNLYDDIKLDFEKCILPHRKVMPPGYTVCPGSNFPVDEFERLIRKYYEGWSGSDEIQAKIKAFKLKDYIYA